MTIDSRSEWDVRGGRGCDDRTPKEQLGVLDEFVKEKVARSRDREFDLSWRVDYGVAVTDYLISSGDGERSPSPIPSSSKASADNWIWLKCKSARECAAPDLGFGDSCENKAKTRRPTPTLIPYPPLAPADNIFWWPSITMVEALLRVKWPEIRKGEACGLINVLHTPALCFWYPAGSDACSGMAHSVRYSHDGDPRSMGNVQSILLFCRGKSPLYDARRLNSRKVRKLCVPQSCSSCLCLPPRRILVTMLVVKT